MHLSRVVTSAARLAGFAFICAVCSSAPAIAASVCAGAATDCQSNNKIEPKSLAFVVTYFELRPGGEFIVTFDNGEVWRQNDRNKSIRLERGEQVVIRRATTGKF